MAKNVPAARQRKVQQRRPVPRRQAGPRTPSTVAIPFDRTNLMIFGAALLVIVIGFGFMSTGMTEEVMHEGIWNSPLAIGVAPVVLVIGYCVIVPLAIMFRPKQTTAEAAE